MKIGASSYIWVSPFSDDLLDQLGHAQELGFDIYEIAVENPSCVTIEKVAAEAQRIGIEIQICGAFGAKRDISSDNPVYRQEGMDYVRTLIDMAAKTNAERPYVAGPMYSATGKTRLLSKEEKEKQIKLAVENMKVLADYAAEKKVRLAIEPLNRFETDFMNTVEQGVLFLEAVNKENVGFLLDTFHMNIEEKSIPDAIRRAKGKVFDFHACANDRGTPGEDHFDWRGIKDALADIQYDGPVVIESFTTEITEIARAVSLWRPLAVSQDELAANGLNFLRLNL